MTVILAAVAFGPSACPVPGVQPKGNAMLSVPPPRSRQDGFVETVKTVVWLNVCPTMALVNTTLGLLRISALIIPTAMKLVRSCGSLAVSVASTFWLGNGTLLLGASMPNGVMSTG